MGRILGIDLGTTNSLVATVDSGFPYVIADVQGNRLTPSVVHLPGGDEGPVVGYPAKRLQVVKPSETIYSIKRFMGRRASEIPREEMLVTYPVRGHENGAVTIDVHGRSWTPEAVSAEILRKLKSDAEQALDEAVDRAVITVPAYFNDAQRNATKRAGEQAGLTVERIVNEPTAAALAYGVDRLKTAVRIAVYDLGGGTFDLTILELKEGVFQVLATCGNTRLGGDDLDTRLVGLLNRRIREAGGPETASDPGLQSRLREAAEEAKVRLSTMEAVDVTLPFLTENFSFEYRLTRKELEETTRDIIASTRSYCQRALADAQLEARDLDQVILVGGQTRMPLVRQTVAELFGCVEEDHAKGSLSMSDSGAESRKGPQLNTSQNPEEAVAIGAAIQGEILAGRMDHLLLLDVTPLSLGIETYGGLMNVLIPRNTTIPVKSGEMFTTAVDNQQSMLIHILQGEREKAKDNWSLGQFNLEFEPAPKGVARVGVQFELDANGILHVLARDTKTGQERRVEVTSAVDVQDETVQQMVEESAEHAFADLRARQWVETKMRAQETLAATRNGLEECGDTIEPANRQEIERLAQEVEAALQSEDPETQTGDLERLRQAVEALDEATRPLADLVMDRAMEKMLRQQGLIE